MDWLGVKLGFNKMEDWYNITAGQYFKEWWFRITYQVQGFSFVVGDLCVSRTQMDIICEVGLILQDSSVKH